MLRFYGASPPQLFVALHLGGVCPHCKSGSRFSRISEPDFGRIQRDGIAAFTADYACDLCLGSIPVRWKVGGWQANGAVVCEPQVMLPTREEFEFEHVPDAVKREVTEGLDCLSVDAFNGFAALCRRVIQSICTNLGAEVSGKVKRQIEEMAELTGLSDDLKDLAFQIMLSGHDGSHPHLPEVDSTRAAVLLSLLRDLTYQLYTRPGKVKRAAQLRSQKVRQGN